MGNLIYAMKLHDEVNYNDLKVLRVPGGWIYIYYSANIANAVFVPFNNEFQELVN